MHTSIVKCIGESRNAWENREMHRNIVNVHRRIVKCMGESELPQPNVLRLGWGVEYDYCFFRWVFKKDMILFLVSSELNSVPPCWASFTITKSLWTFASCK